MDEQKNENEMDNDDNQGFSMIVSNKTQKSVSREDILLTFGQVTCNRYYIDKVAEKVPISFQVYNLDHISQLIYKISTQLNIQASNIYLIIKQKEIILYPHQYIVIVNNQEKLMILEEPSKIYDLTKNRQQSQYKMIGRIPVNNVLLSTYQQYVDNRQIRFHQQFLGDILDTQQPIELQIMCYNDIIEIDGFKQLLQNESTKQLIDHVFIYKYFPNLLIVSNMNMFQQQKMLFYQQEQQLYSLYQQKGLKTYKKSINIKQLEFVTKFRNKRFDLQQLFDNIQLSKVEGLTYLYYCYFNEGDQQIAIKYKSQQDDFIFRQFSEEQLHGGGQDYSFIIYQNATIQYQLNVQLWFQKLDFQQLIDIQKARFLNFISFLESMKHLYSSGDIDINKNVITVNSIMNIQIEGITNPSFYYLHLDKIMKNSPHLFAYQSQMDRYRTIVLFGIPVIIKVMFINEKIEIQYSGIFHESIQLFVDMLLGCIDITSSLSLKQGVNEKDLAQSRKLAIADPYLYTKMKNIQYSRVCPTQKIPELANEDEKDQPNTFEYWNFTTNQPQFYRCPSKFKYLYFRTGHHVDGLCLPCCTDIDQNTTKKKKKRYLECLNTRKSEVQLEQQNYAFRNIYKFQIDRLTIVKVLIQRYLDVGINLSEKSGKQGNMKREWYIHCKTIPQMFPHSRNIVQSLLLSIAFFGNLSLNELIIKLKLFYESIKNMTMIDQINLYQQGTLFTYFNFELWFVNISNFMYTLHNTNLFLIDDNEPLLIICKIQQIKNNSFILLRRLDAINPIVLYHNNKQIRRIYGQIVEMSKSTKKTEHQTFLQQQHKYDKYYESNYLFESIQYNIIQHLPFIPSVIINKLAHFKDIQIQSQIIDKQGFCHYILLQFNQSLYILPTTKNNPVDNIKYTDELPQLKDINTDLDALYSLIQLCQYNITNKLFLDTLCIGFLTNEQHFIPIIPVNIKQMDQFGQKTINWINSLQIQQKLFNPYILNIQITQYNKGQFNKQMQNINYHVNLQAYLMYLYDIITLQVNMIIQKTKSIKSNQETDIEQYFKFMPLSDILELFQQQIEQKTIKQLSSCLANEQQIFCHKHKVIVPKEFMSYFELLQQQNKMGLQNIKYILIQTILRGILQLNHYFKIKVEKIKMRHKWEIIKQLSKKINCVKINYFICKINYKFRFNKQKIIQLLNNRCQRSQNNNYLINSQMEVNYYFKRLIQNPDYNQNKIKQ